MIVANIDQTLASLTPALQAMLNKTGGRAEPRRERTQLRGISQQMDGLKREFFRLVREGNLEQAEALFQVRA